MGKVVVGVFFFDVYFFWVELLFSNLLVWFCVVLVRLLVIVMVLGWFAWLGTWFVFLFGLFFWCWFGMGGWAVVVLMFFVLDLGWVGDGCRRSYKDYYMIVKIYIGVL